MNIVRYVLGAVVVGVGFVSNASAQLAQGEKDTAFIGPVKVNESVEDAAKRRKDLNGLNQLREGLRTELVTEINQTRVFQIVERERKDDIELEQAFAQVGVDPNDKDAAQMMKMKGAKFAFLPRIDAFQDPQQPIQRFNERMSLARCGFRLFSRWLIPQRGSSFRSLQASK